MENSPLAGAADIVLPGSAWVEKDATYTNDQGRVQAASKVFDGPGEAKEDWAILRDVATALGHDLSLATDADVRRAIGAAKPGTAYADIHAVSFSRPMAARNWLQASNPSERWKWDFMFHDNPPVKGHNVQTEQGVVDGRLIPLKPV